MSKLVIVGTIGLDDVETPFGKVSGALGGSAAYASIAASFFNKSAVVSIVGNDMPKKNLAVLHSRNIDLKELVFSDKNFRWSGRYEFDMNEAKTLKTELNSLADFNPKISSRSAKSEFLFVANIDPDIQIKVINQMTNTPFIVLDTMNFWINNKKKSLLKAMSKADLIVVNEAEARQIFDTANLISAGKQLLKMGPKYAVIKKGEHGALLFSENCFFSAPGFPLETVKDPTGAGDSFAGGLIGYISKAAKINADTIRRGVIYGSAIASFCAEDFSANYIKKVQLLDIKERYNVFKEIRRF